MMPGINGFEVARRLKRHFGDAIRIIAVTAHGAEKDRQQSAKAGFELHLLKPVDPSVIQSLLA
jgi:CheY-like chemotaxis protein